MLPALHLFLEIIVSTLLEVVTRVFLAVVFVGLLAVQVPFLTRGALVDRGLCSLGCPTHGAPCGLFHLLKHLKVFHVVVALLFRTQAEGKFALLALKRKAEWEFLWTLRVCTYIQYKHLIYVLKKVS
jgi:hypothetical protein